jgi:2-polyprenyl-3-methyl-5-hydroxy-6-metoxy-1,4-benzoquinol methylase
MIDAAGVSLDDPIIDVGAGASRLVDQLVGRGHRRVSALDISAHPLELVRKRLGDVGADVEWIAEDITDWSPRSGAYQLWHDRAVFHFLTDDLDRAGYLGALNQGLRPGGWLILAPFGPSGPERCSGLTVRRYSADDLQTVLGAEYQLVESQEEEHATPGGASQNFIWCLFRRAGG